MGSDRLVEGNPTWSRGPWLTRWSLLVSLVLLALLAVLVWTTVRPHPVGGGGPPGGAEQAGVVMAPEFEIPLYGSDVHFRLSEHRGQGVVINFWASWCGPCRKEMPVLERGWRAYRERGVVFIGVNVSDSEAAATAFLRQVGVTYPNGPDPRGEVSERYHLIGLPETFFVRPDGAISRRVIGGVTEESLAKAVEAILPK